MPFVRSETADRSVELADWIHCFSFFLDDGPSCSKEDLSWFRLLLSGPGWASRILSGTFSSRAGLLARPRAFRHDDADVLDLEGPFASSKGTFLRPEAPSRGFRASVAVIGPFVSIPAVFRDNRPVRLTPPSGDPTSLPASRGQRVLAPRLTLSPYLDENFGIRGGDFHRSPIDSRKDEHSRELRTPQTPCIEKPLWSS